MTSIGTSSPTNWRRVITIASAVIAAVLVIAVLLIVVALKPSPSSGTVTGGGSNTSYKVTPSTP